MPTFPNWFIGFSDPVPPEPIRTTTLGMHVQSTPPVTFNPLSVPDSVVDEKGPQSRVEQVARKLVGWLQKKSFLQTNQNSLPNPNFATTTAATSFLTDITKDDMFSTHWCGEEATCYRTVHQLRSPTYTRNLIMTDRTYAVLVRSLNDSRYFGYKFYTPYRLMHYAPTDKTEKERGEKLIEKKTALGSGSVVWLRKYLLNYLDAFSKSEKLPVRDLI
ncbi:unnamed protein product [Protopolystoma xenopodis]|uniref:Uncharacterized protein n=1 Tax=Protopolystoma xenopodis TaxID=117903 RepID=A0A3S5B0W8_9PLAT|nr:unnamed protein product [Protopolystoma xenopodis]